MAIPADAVLREMEEAACEIAGRAGEVLLERFRSTLHVEFKDRRGLDPVSDVDRAVEAMVRAELTKRFPQCAVLGEEGDDSGPAGADSVWVVDPLDGTVNFLNGLAVFACSLGLLWRGIPVVGAVFLPTSRHLRPGVYHARRGGGASFRTLGETREDEAVRFRPSGLNPGVRLSAVPAGTRGVQGPRGRRFGCTRTTGSIAAELVLTAEGTLQMSVFEGAKVWDVAGGVVICGEAGAAVHVRSRRRGAWRPLERLAGGDERPPPLTELRSWNDSLAAGNPATLPQLAADLREQQGRLAAMRRLLWRGE